MRALSKVAPEWWDYTTLDEQILDAAAAPVSYTHLRAHET